MKLGGDMGVSFLVHPQNCGWSFWCPFNTTQKQLLEKRSQTHAPVLRKETKGGH